MSLYLDASVLVPLVVVEPQHPDVWDFLGERTRPFIATSFARGETISAISRLVRVRRLTADDARTRLADLDRWFETACGSPAVEDADIRAAAKLVERFDLALKLPDAIHLTCARRLAVPLLTLDERLCRTAAALGVEAIKPA